VKVTYRGAFGYVIGVLRNGENIPLCRLRYGGSAHSFGFAIYSAAHDRYQDAILRTGLPAGTPQEALDTACTEMPRAFRTVHPLGWAIWKGDFLAQTEEELLTGIQGRSREDGDRDVASDRQSSEGARDQRRYPR
jgi:hypothetical protein